MIEVTLSSRHTALEIRALVVWGRARYLSVTEAPHNTDFHTWMGKKHFCFFQTAETGNRTPNPVKGSGANNYPRAPPIKALIPERETNAYRGRFVFSAKYRLDIADLQIITNFTPIVQQMQYNAVSILAHLLWCWNNITTILIKHTVFARNLSKFCETQWPRPPLFSLSWLIQWSMGRVLI